MIVKRTIPGYIWFDGNEIFKLRFHDELFVLRNLEYKNYGTIRRMRMRKRRAAFKTFMKRAELFILATWAAIIGLAAVSAF